MTWHKGRGREKSAVTVQYAKSFDQRCRSGFMCLLALLYRVADAALVVGANREEYYTRGGDPPRAAGRRPCGRRRRPGPRRHLAGPEPSGRPRRRHQPPQVGASAIAAQSRSAARELLALPSAVAAAEQCVRSSRRTVMPAAISSAPTTDMPSSFTPATGCAVRPLPPGIHVLSNRDINDPTDARVVYAGDWLGRQRLVTTGKRPALGRLCASQEPAAAPMCFPPRPARDRVQQPDRLAPR